MDSHNIAIKISTIGYLRICQFAKNGIRVTVLRDLRFGK